MRGALGQSVEAGAVVLPLRRLRIAMTTVQSLANESAFRLKVASEPSQGFPPPHERLGERRVRRMLEMNVEQRVTDLEEL
jgi:hypothetical protein